MAAEIPQGNGSAKWHGRYAPGVRQLRGLRPAIWGNQADDNFYAPSLIPDESFINALQHLFDRSADILKAAHTDIESGVLFKASELADSRLVRLIVDELAASRARLMNHYALSKKLASELIDNQPASVYQPEAFRFVLDLLEQNHNTRNFLIRFFEFSLDEVHLFERFISCTVMALFAMGYPDAAHHSSQVARLCVVKAAKNGAGRPELLQAVMVGWLHDPKLMTTLSIDNLSTHPVVASAMAYGVLYQPTFFNLLKIHLNSLGAKPHCFIRGVTDALSVNNDSRFVAERFIYDQVAMQIVRQCGKALGEPLTQNLWKTHQQRLGAPSRGVMPDAFSETLVVTIGKTQLDSGFIGLQKEAWRSACIASGALNDGDPEIDKQADALYQAALIGKFKTPGQLKTITHMLLNPTDPNQPRNVRWMVNGLHLFSHHDEVCIHGKAAALALVCSDPLMLSPHKIMEVRPNDEPLIKRLQSYMVSLKSNINDLPKSARLSALTWQRSIYLCLLKAAKKLAGGNALSDFYNSHHNTSVEEDLEALEVLVLSPKTWKQSAHLTNVGDDELQFTYLLELLKFEYLQMCQYYRDAVLAQDVNEAKIL